MESLAQFHHINNCISRECGVPARGGMASVLDALIMCDVVQAPYDAEIPAVFHLPALR